MMTMQKYRFALSVAAALALGCVVRTGYPWLIVCSVLTPALFLAQQTRREAWLCAAAYFLAATSALPLAVTGFFGPGESRAQGLYVLAAVLLSLPWCLVWGRNCLCLRSVGGVLLGVVPPLGLIGWASPLMAAGWLFPGTTVYVGVPLLMLSIAAGAALLDPEKAAIAGLLVGWLVTLSLGCNLAFWVNPAATPTICWEGVTLHADRKRGALTEYTNLLAMQERAASSMADVLVFPEGVQENWSEVTEFEWADTFAALKAKHHTVLLGATSLDVAGRYRNGLVIRGAEVDRFQQRIPVPLAMWHPFAPSGVPLRLFSPGTVTVGPDRVGVLMCYEMTIPFPALTMLAEQPTRLAGLANDWWADGTPSVPRWQATALKGWARLAGIPSTLAINLPKGSL